MGIRYMELSGKGKPSKAKSFLPVSKIKLIPYFDPIVPHFLDNLRNTLISDLEKN